MPSWHRMPGLSTAVRRAAIAELRVVFAGLRCAARLLQSARGRQTIRSLARTLERAAARGERAVERLAREER